MGKPITLTDQTFDDEVSKAEVPVLVDFWAPWCGPCKMIGPIIEELVDDLAGKAKVCKLNVDDYGSTATKFGVISIPTLLVFKGGEPAERMIGFMPKAKLLEKLKAHITA